MHRLLRGGCSPLSRGCEWMIRRRMVNPHSRFSSQPDRTSPRERMDYDVVIVGAGPAGLASAIRLKQLAPESLSVCVVEKAAELGGHTLSGAVIEARSLDELLPDWRERDAPIHEVVQQDEFVFLTEKNAIRLPNPPTMHNAGKNYIVSLGSVVAWMGQQAEELGVDIFPGFAASEVLFSSDGKGVLGIATGDVGIAKDGTLKDTFSRGMELYGRQTIFAEGCRGSLSKQVIQKFNLADGRDPQTYGLGIKEVWEIDPKNHRKGLVSHSIGWPLDWTTYGGSWMYHYGENRVSIGFVVGLDYKNPYLSPYEEFQRFKQHPSIRRVLEGGNCVSYGARTIVEGGIQSLPRLMFPGGVLAGDSAGFLNVPKIKGTHTAMKSGMLAAESVFEALQASSGEQEENTLIQVSSYEESFRKSWLYDELHSIRNIRPAMRFSLPLFLGYSALDTYVFRGRAPWTLHHQHADHEATLPASKCEPIVYPKPDGVISFDLLTNLARSGTNHEHDQPAHLVVVDPSIPTSVNLPVFDGPEQRFCPAKVYEYHQDGESGSSRLVINAQNCLHCKACDIKDPKQNINWTTPEGGGGPAYSASM